MDKIEIIRALTQAEINAFAKLSGDCNPIHLDKEFAAQTRFGRTIVHGVFLQSILQGLCDQLRPGERHISQSLSFTAPTYADEEMRFSARISSKDENILICEVSRVDDNTSACKMEIQVGAT